MTADTRPAARRLRTADFDYELPERLIAQRPAPDRDASRLLILDRESETFDDRRFPDLLHRLDPGDALVLNDTRVFPARLVGRKPTGAAAEVLLLNPLPGDEPGRDWEAIVRPGGKLKPGREVIVSDALRVHILDSTSDGGRVVRLDGEGEPMALVEKYGSVPLPPYVQREADAEDRKRYQTVYARATGSVAAPTAGLHFTPELLASIEGAGVSVVRVTLHVGLGTFRPVEVEDPEEHEMHAERWSLTSECAALLNSTREAGGRIWAVGTTSARVLETAVTSQGRFRSGEGWTDLYIRPPRRITGLDGLLTNFHLPRSSLLMLVSAFAGREFVLEAYRHAVREEYRFFSYGDAMLIL
ncbi:MAG: tRNA preQ1(34) S-adenosylmethionine ribosyltransferase-isomerase QueA [Gemmatimonadota bacterium]